MRLLNLDPAQYGIATQLGQREVFAVYSHDGSSCGKANSKYVFVRSNVETIDEFINGRDDVNDLAETQQYLEQKLGSDTILVMNSSNADVKEVAQVLQRIETNSKLNKPVCDQLWVPDGLSQYLNQRTYMFAENVDATLYTDDNGQAVWMVAPVSVGGSMNGFVAVLNNVRTNTSSDLQTGFYFTNNLGQIVFANNGTNLFPYAIPVDYYPGNSYFIVNTYTSGFWWHCAQNASLGSHTWRCIKAPGATGSHIGVSGEYSVFTSIMLENSNSIWSWRIGFPQNIAVGAASIVRNGYHYPWSGMHKHSAWNCSPFSFPSPYLGMSGNLTSSGALWFELAQIPSRC
jgi:hypothetical protein